jgi:hypothetical protein
VTTRHQMTFLGTSPRSCVVSPPNTPLVTRWPNFVLPQASERRPQAVARRHHSTLPSMTTMREPRAVRRSASNVLIGLRPQLTTMVTTMRKQATPVWGTSRLTHVVASARCGLLRTTLRDSSRRPALTMRTPSSTSSMAVT